MLRARLVLQEQATLVIGPMARCWKPLPLQIGGERGFTRGGAARHRLQDSSWSAPRRGGGRRDNGILMMGANSGRIEPRALRA
jgi:hypothetical protein